VSHDAVNATKIRKCERREREGFLAVVCVIGGGGTVIDQ